MNRTLFACAPCALLIAAAFTPFSGGCNPELLVVVANDGGTKGHPGNTDDGGGTSTHDGGGGGACVSDGIDFGLTVNTTEPACTGGSSPPWPAASFGCPGWLTIAPAGGSASSLNLVSGGCVQSCIVTKPQPAANQSFKWDGTYYPTTQTSNPNDQCVTPECAPAGNYVATICIGYGANEDAGAYGCSAVVPTCKQVSFVWPPTSANQSIVETIPPTPDGG